MRRRICATGLGLYEYMQLAEAVGAEPVWVINNGVAHADSVPTSDIQPWVQVLRSISNHSCLTS